MDYPCYMITNLTDDTISAVETEDSNAWTLTQRTNPRKLTFNYTPLADGGDYTLTFTITGANDNTKSFLKEFLNSSDEAPQVVLTTNTKYNKYPKVTTNN